MPKKIEVSDRKFYIEIDNLRLVYEDGELVGYYNPEGPSDDA